MFALIGVIIGVERKKFNLGDYGKNGADFNVPFGAVAADRSPI